MQESPNRTAMGAISLFEAIHTRWNRLPKAVRVMLGFSGPAVLAVWGFSANLVPQAKVAIALLLFGSAFWLINQATMFARLNLQGSQLPSTESTTLPQPAITTIGLGAKHRVSALQRNLRRYQEGLEAIGIRLTRGVPDSEIVLLKQRMSDLLRPALQTLLDDGAGILSPARGKRFTQRHPGVILVKPDDWSQARFDFSTELWSRISHLEDFDEELGEILKSLE